MIVTQLFLAGLVVNFYLAWDTLPYFPVEISHTLKATDANVSFNIFVLGVAMIALLPELFPFWPVRYWAVFGALMLAYDDHRVNLHQLAIYNLLVTFLGTMWWQCGWNVTLAFAVFYFSRAVSKVYLVGSLLLHKPWKSWFTDPWKTFLESYEYIKRPKEPGHVVLRLGAVWQWLVWTVAIYLLETKPQW